MSKPLQVSVDRQPPHQPNRAIIGDKILKHIPQGAVQEKVCDWERKILEVETEDQQSDNEQWLHEDYPDLSLKVLKDTYPVLMT